MGAKCTETISRERAIAFILEHLDSVSDETIAYALEVINDDLLGRADYGNSLGLCNFTIGN